MSKATLSPITPPARPSVTDLTGRRAAFGPSGPPGGTWPASAERKARDARAPQAPRPVAAPAPGLAPLPSVHDLVRHAAIAMNRTDPAGNLTCFGMDRYDALALVALCIPAETIQDAAAHLALAYQAAAELEDGLGDKAFAEGLVNQIQRALLSALPLVASAAGVDLVSLGAEALMPRRAEVFGLSSGQS